VILADLVGSRKSVVWRIRSLQPVCRESWESGVLADLGLKLGIDLFAGKSEITEGCSDFREIGDSSDLPGISDLRCQRATGAMLLMMRTSVLRRRSESRSRPASRAVAVGAGID